VGHVYEIAIKEHGRRLQVLELIFEMSDGRMVECQPVELAASRFGMNEEDVTRAARYWAQNGCLKETLWGGVWPREPDPFEVTLTAKGIDELTRIAFDLLRKDSSFAPALWLEENPSRKITPRRTAILKGAGRFQSVSQVIGISQLLFIHLLFASKRETNLGYGPLTVVSEDDVVRELIRWSEAGFKRLSAADRENPRMRVRKEWSAFVQRTEDQVPVLKGYFHRVSDSAEQDHALFGIGLPSVDVMSRLWNLDMILEASGNEELTWDQDV
jgi:hypothetical protein